MKITSLLIIVILITFGQGCKTPKQEDQKWGLSAIISDSPLIKYVKDYISTTSIDSNKIIIIYFSQYDSHTLTLIISALSNYEDEIRMDEPDDVMFLGNRVILINYGLINLLNNKKRAVEIVNKIKNIKPGFLLKREFPNGLFCPAAWKVSIKDGQYEVKKTDVEYVSILQRKIEFLPPKNKK
jgi:hypothetical protein